MCNRKILYGLVFSLYGIIIPNQVIAEDIRFFSVKSATIEYEFRYGSESNDMDSHGVETLTFDDYGWKQAIESRSWSVSKIDSTTSPVSQKNEKLIITDPRAVYFDTFSSDALAVNVADFFNRAKSKSLEDYQREEIAWLESVNYEDLGTKTIAGKVCRHVRFPDLNANFCRWNGIDLQTTMNLDGFVFSQTAVNIQINETVPEETFTIPQNLTMAPSPDDPFMKKIVLKSFNEKTRYDALNALAGYMRELNRSLENFMNLNQPADI